MQIEIGWYGKRDEGRTKEWQSKTDITINGQRTHTIHTHGIHTYE